MSRPKSIIPVYRKHSSGNARVTINGRDYLLGPYGTKTSNAQYDRLIAEFLASGRSPSFGVASDQLSMAVVMSSYAAHAKRYYGTGTSSEFHRIKLAIKPIRALYLEHSALSGAFRLGVRADRI